MQETEFNLNFQILNLNKLYFNVSWDFKIHPIKTFFIYNVKNNHFNLRKKTLHISLLFEKLRNFCAQAVLYCTVY